MSGSAPSRLILGLHGGTGQTHIEHERVEAVLGAKGVDLGQRRLIAD
jgi:hypothetical protein